MKTLVRGLLAHNRPVTLIALLAFLCVNPQARGATYYVSPAGDDSSNSGTQAAPFRTLRKACAAATAGDTVFIRSGTYREQLIPPNSGEEGRPIVFQAFEDEPVMIKGSEVVTGFVKEERLWVKRPWTKTNYWEDSMCDISDAPYRESARADQVFINEQPLQWVPSRADLKPGCFYWKGADMGGELVIYPPETVTDPNTALTEVPVLPNLVGACSGDPPQNRPAVHHIHLKKLRFRHAAQIHNRAGVRLDGDHWLLEDCVVEYMNAIGVVALGSHCTVRRCTINHNGQAGLGDLGSNSLVEDVVTLFNNRKLFSISWGGAGNKATVMNGHTIRGLISAFNHGSGLWYDIYCRNVLVEDSVSLGNRPVNGGFFYEISRDAVFRRNIAFANYSTGSDFYGAGFVVAASRNISLEDNVVIGGEGGVAVGTRDQEAHTGHTVRNNIIVEPRTFSLHIDKESVSVEAKNRYERNTLLVESGSGRGHFGSRSYADREGFLSAVPASSGNRWVTDISQLNGNEAARLNDAFKRILNALAVVDPRLRFNVSSSALEAIWPLGDRSEAIGYWVKADGTHYLLLDVSKPANIRLAGSGKPCLWDCRVLHPPVRVPLSRDDETFVGRVEGPFALITGLGSNAHPASVSTREDRR